MQNKRLKWMKAVSLLLSLTLAFTSVDVTVLAAGIESEGEAGIVSDVATLDLGGGSTETGTGQVKDEAKEATDLENGNGADEKEAAGTGSGNENSGNENSEDEENVTGAGSENENSGSENVEDGEDITETETDKTEKEAAEGISSDNAEISIQSDDMSIKASNGLGSLLLDELQTAAGEEESGMQADYDIAEITMSGSTAEVSLQVSGACTVVVGIYGEKSIKPIVFGSAFVEAGEGKVSVPLEIGTMPEYFVIKGYIVDTDTLKPLSMEYESHMYTRAMQEFLKKKTSDFDADKVLNLDDDEETNFAVVNDGNVLIKAHKDENDSSVIINDFIKYDETANTYTFANIDDTLRQLKAGDIFTYQDETAEDKAEVILAIKVADIKIQESTEQASSDEETTDKEDGDEETAAQKTDSEEETDEETADKETEDEDTVAQETDSEEETDEEISNKENETEKVADEETSVEDEAASNNVETTGSGTIAVITAASKELTANDVFDYIKIEETAASIDADEIDAASCPSGVEYLGRDGAAGQALTNEDNPFKVTDNWSLKLGEFGNDYDDDNDKIVDGKFAGDLTVSLSLNLMVTYYYSKAQDKDSSSIAYVDIKLSPSFTLSGDCEIGGRLSKRLLTTPGEIKTKIITVEYIPRLVAEVTLEGEFELSITQEFGLRAGWGADDIGPYASDMTIEGDLQIAVDGYLGIDFNPKLKVASGAVVDAELDAGVHLGITAAVAASEFHECGLMCVDGSMYWELPLAASFEILSIELTDAEGDDPSNLENTLDIEGSGIFNTKHELGAFYFCGKHEKKIKWGDCPYKSEAVEVTLAVHDSDGKPVQGAVVSTSEETYSVKTDADGFAKIEVKEGKQHFFAAYTDADGGVHAGSATYDVKEGERTRPIVNLDAMSAKLPKGQKVKYITSSSGIGSVASSSGIAYLAITEDNSLYTWGNNPSGILGNGSTSKSEEPVMILENIKEAAIRNSSAAAVTMSGKLYTWGANNYGQLGLGADPNEYSSFTQPKEVEIPGGADKVRISNDAVAVVTKNNELYMWGRNTNGRLGLGNDDAGKPITANYNSPQKVMEQIKDVRINNYITMALTTDGKVYTWGNSNGSCNMLGNGSNVTRYVADMENPVLTGVESIELSDNNAAAVTEEGNLYIWGSNGYGETGTGATGSGSSAVKSDIENVEFVALFEDSAAAVTQDGSLYMWGKNNNGMLGDGTGQSKTLPYKIPEMENTHITELSSICNSSIGTAMYGKTLAVTGGNELWQWGKWGGTISNGENKPEKKLSNVKHLSLSRMNPAANVPSYGLYACYVSMSDGSAWEYSDGSLTFLPFMESAYTMAAGEYSVETGDMAEEVYDDATSDYALFDYRSPKTFEGLVPGGLYNFYAMKSRTVSAPLENHNLLAIAQGRADADGRLTIDFDLRESYGRAELFVVGENQLILNSGNVEVTGIEELMYNGSEQYCRLVVTYEGSRLTEGRDYYLDGDYKASEIGVYTAVVAGMGLYSGTVAFEWQITPVMHTITFDSDGGSAVESTKVVDGEAAAEPETPVKDGYRFIGWYLNSNLYDFTAKVTKDLTLKAKWEELPVISAPAPDIPSGKMVKPWTAVSLTCAEEGAVIYYTTDGSEPDLESSRYRMPIMISKDTTIKAFASKEGFKNSETVSFSYKVSDEGENEGDDYDDVLTDDIPDAGVPEGLWVAGVKTSYPYTGKAVKPEIRVYNGSKRLVEGRDYTAAFKNNVKASGNASITVRGKGNYSGTETKTFTITPVDLSDLTDNRIEADAVTAAYNKKVQKPVPVITFNGTKLKKNKDFTVSYPSIEKGASGANKNIGVYDIVVQGKPGGNFTGSRTLKFTITNKTLISKATVKIPSQSYNNGLAVQPLPTVSLKGAKLISGQDYTVTYKNNTEIGTATAVITGKGKYAGVKNVNFKITGRSIAKVSVSGLDGIVYNGREQKPVLSLSLNGEKLTKGVNYKVEYTNNIKAGRATVIITGINDCTGTVKKTFKIQPFDLTADAKLSAGERRLMIVDEDFTLKYVKGGAKPNPVLIYEGMKLKERTDYTISYKNNKKPAGKDDAKAPTFTIKGKGNFKGTLTHKFTIEAKVLNDAVSPVTITAPDIAYVDKPGKYMSKPILMDADGTKLVQGKDYSNIVYSKTNSSGEEITLTNKDKAGAGDTIRVKVSGAGEYAGGELWTEYRVTLSDFAKANITIKPQEYTGDAVYLDKEAIKSVKAGGVDITDQFGESYEIVEGSYKNNIKKGTASVTIRGKGNYGGSRTVKFKITTKKFGGFLWF